MSGKTAQRGFIFQTIIAMIECLERNDWDEVKLEPDTKQDKVDIQLYHKGMILSAIQVKSSQNEFRRCDVEKWLEEIRKDAENPQEIQLILVGDKFSSVCKDYIAQETSIKTVSFKHLDAICLKSLNDYILYKGIGDEISVSDMKTLDNVLFSQFHINSIKDNKTSRSQFENEFQRMILRNRKATGSTAVIPRCLTPIPTVNREVGLVGRDEVIKEVRNALERDSLTALVSGIGGIGKTALMQWICNAVKEERHYVAWIDCGRSLKKDFLVLGGELGITGDDPDVIYRRIIHALKTQLDGKLYIFMDNLSRKMSQDELKELNSLHAHIMVTSRLEDPVFPRIKVEALEEDMAVAMFYRYYNGDTVRPYEESVRHIVRTVNRHTLLIELLAKAVWKKGGTLDAFDRELEVEGFFSVFRRKLSTQHDENLTIEESIMRLYQISGLSEKQQRIMKLFSIFTPEKEIYYKIAEWADLDFDALDKLVELAWLGRGGLENGYHIHQIIKDSISRQIDVEDEGKDAESIDLSQYGELVKKIADVDSYLSGAVEYTFVRERLVLADDVIRFLGIRAEKMLFSYQDTGVLSDENVQQLILIAEIYNNIGEVYYYQGDYIKTLNYYEKSLAIRKIVLGEGHHCTATTYNNIGVVYNDQGEYVRALEYHKKSLAIREKVFGADHPSIATTYNNIGVVYCTQGDNVKALEYYEKALVIQEKVLGTDHTDTAATYNNIGGVYYNEGDCVKALEYFEKALFIQEKVLGEDHSVTANTYNNMAGVYSAQGDYVKALKYYEKTLAIQEKVLGTDHTSIAKTYDNIGVMYCDQGDYVKALEYHKKSLAMRKKVLGVYHSDTATTYNNIGVVYREQGDYVKALEYCKKTLAIDKKVLGIYHPNTATTYNNIGVLYYHQRDDEKALEYCTKALAIRKKVLGSDHLDIATTNNNIGGMYHTQGDYVKAREYYEKALEVFRIKLGDDHPYTRDVLKKLSSLRK